MQAGKRFGIPPLLLARPLTEPLRGIKELHLVEQPRPVLARRLREHELDAALISPLDYARDSSDYTIVPGACVASEGNGSIVVCFKQGIKQISTLAADPAFASEIILARIILAEEFEIEPVIVPMEGTLEQMLDKADAALVAGDAAFRQGNPSTGFIDIVEEWVEMTGLPYVHALWCAHEHRITPRCIEPVQTARIRGVEGIGDIAHQFPKDERRGVQEFLESFTYDFLPDVQEGLAEFMKYLFYHGVTPDVSDLNFYRMTSEADSLPGTVSPN